MPQLHSPQNDDVFCMYYGQVDGNISVLSSNSSLSDGTHVMSGGQDIPVFVGFRPESSINIRLPPVLKTIRRDNKVLQALTLPKLSIYNMRSLIPKNQNFGEDMADRDCDLSFLTELWEKSENKKHQYKIEELFELKGLKYISTPRPGSRRGGGAALVSNTERFSITKLNIPNPKNLEVVWGLVRPKNITGKITKIISCCFYSPPRSRKKTALIEHLTFTLQDLLNTFPSAGIIISGDRNDLSIDRLLSVDSSLKQIVTKGTRGPNNILDVVLTNLDVYYDEPKIVPPIDVDDPAKGGVPSDHSGVIVDKRANTDKPHLKPKICRTIRPITTSAVNNISQVFVAEDWKFLNPDMPPTSLVDVFQYYTGEILDTFCPSKTIYTRPNDHPWVTENMKHMKRQILREYERKGKTPKYRQLKNIYEEKLHCGAQKYRAKLENELANGDRKSCYAAIRKLGARPGANDVTSFTLPNHPENNFSARQSAELMASHFANISQDYKPIKISNFPPKMRHELSQPGLAGPILQEYEVYKKILKSKKPNSSVPGDIPKRIVQEFSVELATPVTIIYNSILATLEYPRQWVVEHQIPLPKVHPPSSEDDLRNLAKTAFFSKVFESFLSEWLIPIVQPYLDPCQYGLKGTSINHYLLKLLKFTHEYLDLKNPHAVVIAMVDLSKAFNRVSHQMVIEDLYDMNVPPWLLLILTSYLTGRSMILTYQGESSSPRSLPGSSPQGAFLGIFFFIVKYNAASLRPKIPRITFDTICKTKFKTCKKRAECIKHAKDTHAIFIDDLSEAEAIELKEQLNNDVVKRPFPLNYHERTQQILQPGSILQQNLNKIESYTQTNQMVINPKKSKIIMFNKSRKYDFPPEYSFQDGNILEVVEETKLLGIHLSSSLKWDSNTRAICKKAMSKIWLLRRLKNFKMEPELILDYYVKECRPLLEQGVPIWNSGLTKAQIRAIENIQKVALKIILGENYITYEVACTLFNLLPLEYRRSDLAETFAIKLYKSSKCFEFFEPVQKQRKTRNEQLLVKEKVTNTQRCFNAPHNYLARLVNRNKDRIIENNQK